MVNVSPPEPPVFNSHTCNNGELLLSFGSDSNKLGAGYAFSSIPPADGDSESFRKIREMQEGNMMADYWFHGGGGRHSPFSRFRASRIAGCSRAPQQNHTIAGDSAERRGTDVNSILSDSTTNGRRSPRAFHRTRYTGNSPQLRLLRETPM